MSLKDKIKGPVYSIITPFKNNGKEIDYDSLENYIQYMYDNGAKIFYAMAFTQIQSTLGIMPGLKAFIAAVFGGIGNITGAMIGGYVIGIIETMTKAYISSKWVDAIVFGMLILILLFRPAGLFGKNEKEKV